MNFPPPPFKTDQSSSTEVGGIPFHLGKESSESQYQTQNKQLSSIKGPCFCASNEFLPRNDQECSDWQEMTSVVKKHPKYLLLKDKIRRSSAILRLKKKTAYKLKNLCDNELNKRIFMEHRKIKPDCSPLISNDEWITYLQDVIKNCVLEPVLLELQLILLISKNDKHNETIHKEYKNRIFNSSPKLYEVLSLLYSEYLESGFKKNFGSYIKKILGKVDRTALIKDLDTEIEEKKNRLEQLKALIK